MNQPKLNKFLPTKKVYKSKLNFLFVFLFVLGSLIIKDPQFLELLPKEVIGYISIAVSTIGFIIRTFYTETVLEV